MTTTLARPWEKLKLKPQSNSAGPIDDLAVVREQMKALKAREEELVAIVKDMGAGEHAGSKCRAVVQIIKQSRLDTTALKAALPEQMIEKYTKTSDIVKVTIRPLVDC